MSSTLPGADVRGFYESLGIELPGWAQGDTGAVLRRSGRARARDRDPSCSVNLETGAWRCWGCGATGGAYDAALARGLDSRQAFELKVVYGLAGRDSKRPRASRSVRPPAALARRLSTRWR